MKRIFTILFTLALVATAAAQHGPSKHQPIDKSVAEMVSDLTPVQKRKLENLQKESKERVENLKQQRKALCDSICAIMDQYGDHSRELNPMLDRDAALQAAISREYYRVKVRVDEILTKEQYNELSSRMKQKKEQDHKSRKGDRKK